MSRRGAAARFVRKPTISTDPPVALDSLIVDGISMRIARQYAISSDTVPCRIDVLWGFGGLYPEEYAVRSFHQLT